MNNIEYKNKTKIVTKDNEKYVYKIKKHNKDELFQYLKNKSFLNFLPYEEMTNQYEIYRYIDDEYINKDDKAIELILILSTLHTKTTTYREIDIEKTKELYENTKEMISKLRNYYYELQDYIETKIYMSPAEQLLMKNISKFYKALNYSEKKLDDWYQEKEKMKTERVVLLHNNLSLDHFLKKEIPYFISWDNSKKDIVIFDFLSFYKNECLNLEMNSLFDIYQSKYRFTDDEQLLFQSLIAIPSKITFEKTNYINTVITRKVIDYIEKTNAFISKYNEKNKSTNKEEFK